MNYIKLNLSFGDRMRLLFFGIVSEDKLPVKEIIKEVEKERVVIHNTPNVPVPPPAADINTGDELKLNIPFFETNDKDVRSNF